MTNKVIVIGAGRMGFGVIKTLLAKGYDVGVNDSVPAVIERAEKIGAKHVSANNPEHLNGAVVILSLPGPAQVHEITDVINSLQYSIEPVILDISTINPETAITVYEKLKKNGIDYVEAPVSGGPKGAETGTLSMMVGANKDVYDRIEPILKDMGTNIYYLGEVGTGSIAKICNNIIVASTTAILSEAFILASAGGIKPESLSEILSKSVGGSKTLEVFGHHIVEGNYENPTFALSLMHKDVGLYTETAKYYGLTSLVGELTAQIYNGALHSGLGNEDHSAICKYIEKINNKPIERKISIYE